MKRLLFVVDAENLFYSAVATYGRGARVNYIKLLRASRGNQIYDNIHASCYLAYMDEVPQNFVSLLKSFGYDIYLKRTSPQGRGGVLQANWDVGIVVDVMENEDRFEHLALATGDGDFLPLVHHLKRRGKIVRLLTFPASCGKNLPNECDEVISLDESFLIRRKNEV